MPEDYYILIRKNSAIEFREAVYNAFRQGFLLYGPLIVFQEQDKTIYIREMIRQDIISEVVFDAN